MEDNEPKMKLVFSPGFISPIWTLSPGLHPNPSKEFVEKLLRENPDVMKAIADKFDEYVIKQVTKSKDGSTGNED